MQTRIIDAQVAFVERPFVKPLQLSSGAIDRLTEARVTVRVRVGTQEATGRGSIYLSDLWAWPGTALSHAEKDDVLRRVCAQIAANLPGLCGKEPAHALELGLRLHGTVCQQGGVSATAAVPPLALAMCTSPFDAAIHDAVGIARGCSAFDLYAQQASIPCADALFPGEGACAAIKAMLRSPRSAFDAWWIVGAADSMEHDLKPAIQSHGYRCFKLKLLGRDNAADAARTAEVYRAACRMGCVPPRITVDTNEANPDAASVLDYLERLRMMDGDAFAALEYLEQPTARDIRRAAFDWRPVTCLKPVMMDEGLTGLELLEVAMAQGWSGFALKTCKGHSFALVVAAWARRQRLAIALQDLTNPGLSAIHAALFASRIATVNGVELNSPQYTPAANQEWLPRLAGLLAPRAGSHILDGVNPIGLGSMS